MRLKRREDTCKERECEEITQNTVRAKNMNMLKKIILSQNDSRNQNGLILASLQQSLRFVLLFPCCQFSLERPAF